MSPLRLDKVAIEKPIAQRVVTQPRTVHTSNGMLPRSLCKTAKEQTAVLGKRGIILIANTDSQRPLSSAY